MSDFVSSMSSHVAWSGQGKDRMTRGKALKPDYHNEDVTDTSHSQWAKLGAVKLSGSNVTKRHHWLF